MIGNITKGSNFKPLLKYLLEKEKAELVSSNMLGENYSDLPAEFDLSRQLRPTVKQPVYHVSLSLDPKEKLSDRQWDEVARKYLKEMGFENSQFVAVKHSDREHSHLHIVTNKIDLDGKVVNTDYDYFRSQKVIRQLEKEYNLRQVPCSWECTRRQQTRHEIAVINQTWDNSVRRHLQKTIDEVVDYNFPLTVPQLLKQLKKRDISHQVYYAESVAVRGLSYQYQGINYSGTSLGRAYSFPGLQRHKGVTCDRTIEREIYNTCTIAPDTPAATTELLQSREASQQFIEYLKKPRSYRETAKRIEAERERLELEIAKSKQAELLNPQKLTKDRPAAAKPDLFDEIELVTRKPSQPENPAQTNSRLEQGMDEARKQQKLAQQAEWEAINRAIEHQNHILRIERAERQRKAKKEAEQEKQRQQKELREIKDLAPVFTPAIAYTQFEGVEFPDYKPLLSSPVEKFKALFNISDDSLAEKFPSSILNENKTIRVETKHYIITVKDNPTISHHLSNTEILSLGANSSNLTIERKGERIHDEILSINFLNYEKPDRHNIHIVHNALTDDDKQQLMSLQTPVNRIKAEHQKAWDDAVAAVKQGEIDRQLEATPFTGDKNSIKQAVVVILCEKGRVTSSIDSKFTNDDLHISWKEQFEHDDRQLHHRLNVFRLDRTGIEEDKLIFQLSAKTSRSCSKPSEPDWKIVKSNLSQLDAKRINDIYLPIAKELLADDFGYYAHLVALDLGKRNREENSWIYDGKQYKVAIDSESVKVWSKQDEHCLIFHSANNSQRDRFKNAAVNKFEEKDYQWFKSTNQKIKKIQKEHDLQRHYQKQQQKQRQREKGGGGLEL